MKISNRLKWGIASAAVVTTIAGVGSAYAANTIGTVTGKDGDVKDKVSMEAEVTSASGSHVTLKDTATGQSYETSVGPSWYSGSYNTGDKVTIEGVATTGDNDNNHNFQVTKINDVTLRESFEGKPAWAGQRGSGKDSASSSTARHGNGQGSNFVDNNNDGVCDNQ